MKAPCVYLLASKRDGVLYVGVTSDLAKRMAEHTQGLLPGFTKRYGIKHLVYYEMHGTMDAAIRREKQMKEWRRAWKVRLIETMNPEWRNGVQHDLRGTRRVVHAEHRCATTRSAASPRCRDNVVGWDVRGA